jgi:hypothetical protein
MKSIMMAAALAALGGCATMGTSDEAPPASLSLYYGCTAPALEAIKAALRAAPEMLPVAAYIGKH